MFKPTDDVVQEGVLFADVFGIDEDDEEFVSGFRESGRVRVCEGEWRREPDGRWRLYVDEDGLGVEDTLLAMGKAG